MCKIKVTKQSTLFLSKYTPRCNIEEFVIIKIITRFLPTLSDNPLPYGQCHQINILAKSMQPVSRI